MSSVEIIGIIIAIVILAKNLPTLLFFNSMKNRFRNLEKIRDSTINYLFWATLIIFLIFSAFIIPTIGFLIFIVSGIIFSLFFSLFLLSKPSIYRALVKEILRQSNSWLRWMSVLGTFLGLLLLYLLFW